MTTAPTDYRDMANKRFESLLGQEPDFWKVASAFDTMIDFVAYCSKDPAGDALKAATWAIRYSPFDPAGIWFDDFGWWTIATARAAATPNFAKSKVQLGAIATKCWSAFSENAPYVWERKKKGTFENCAPAVPGGVWNGYWKGTSDDWHGPKDGNPDSGTLLGIQNTVTNAVNLLSAQVFKDDSADKREFGFLDAWLNMPSPNPGPNQYKIPLLWWQDAAHTQALVFERATHFQDGKAPGFQTNWAWTGDQGLIIGALVGQAIRPDTLPAKRKQLLKLAEQLLAGAQLRLVQPKNHILNYWTLTGQPPSISKTDPKANWNDYSTGTGVFWRYILRVWNANVTKTLGTPAFKAILTANADEALKAPAGPRQWPNGYKPGQDWVTLTNDLAVLVAAYKMLA